MQINSRVKVSIAMCTYNGEKFLLEQLNSFLMQTVLPNELIIYDDCSTDSTLEIIEDFAKNAPFQVKFYKNKINIGSTKNFENAINSCQGEIIFLSDQDDVWIKNKIEIMLVELERSSCVDVVFSDAKVVDNDLNSLGYNLWDSVEFTKKQRRKIQEGRGLEVLLKQNVVTGAAMAFRSKLRPMFLPLPVNWIHDGWIALIAVAVSNISCIPQPLILYRQHESNQIGGRKKSLFQEIEFSKKIKNESYKIIVDQYKVAFERLNKNSKIKNYEKFDRAVQNKIKLFEIRATLSPFFHRRIFPVFFSLLNLNYFFYARGLKSFLKDISGH